MKQPSILFIITLTSGILTYNVSWANPCLPIAEACLQQGYYKGGKNVGKGLIEDCVKPIASGNKMLPNTNFSLSTLQACQTTIQQKMKSQQ